MALVEEKLEARLRNLAKNRKTRALLQHLQRYTNNMRCTFVDNLAKGSGLTEREVREVLAKLENLKLGALRLGRHGRRTRFEWDSPLTLIARTVGDGPMSGSPIDLGDTSWLDEALESDDDSFVQAEEVSEEKSYHIPLGGGRFAHLRLPTLCTAEDIAKLKTFLGLFD
jgi:hypothetical protein